MKKLFAAVLLALTLFSSSAQATTTLRAQDSVGNSVTITDGVCASAGAMRELTNLNKQLVAAKMDPIAPDALHAASVFYEKKEYGACWVLINSDVVVLDDGGQENSIFGVPANQFRPPEPMI